MNDKGLSDRSPETEIAPAGNCLGRGDFSIIRLSGQPLEHKTLRLRSRRIFPLSYFLSASADGAENSGPGVTSGRPRAKTETEPPSGPESSPASRPPSVRPPPFRAATMLETRGDGESTGRQIPTAPSPHSRRRNRAYRIFGLSPAHSAIGGITPMAITSSRSLAKWR